MGHFLFWKEYILFARVGGISSTIKTFLHTSFALQSWTSLILTPSWKFFCCIKVVFVFNYVVTKVFPTTLGLRCTTCGNYVPGFETIMEFDFSFNPTCTIYDIRMFAPTLINNK